MNKLKLGKKKILGFMTAGAIIVTMAGSYATWDTLESSTESTVSLRKPVVVTATESVTYSTDTALNEFPVYTSDGITIKATDVPTGVKTKLKVDAKVYDTSDTNRTTPLTGFNTTITDSKDGTTGETSFATGEAASAGETYKVTVAPTDDTKAGQDVVVVVTGTLSEDTSGTPAS